MRETSCQRNDHQNSSQIICFQDVEEQETGIWIRTMLTQHIYWVFVALWPWKYNQYIEAAAVRFWCQFSRQIFSYFFCRLCNIIFDFVLVKGISWQPLRIFCLDALLSAILALQLLCATRAVCTALSARVLAGTSRSCPVLLSATGILAFALVTTIRKNSIRTT